METRAFVYQVIDHLRYQILNKKATTFAYYFFSFENWSLITIVPGM